ncbi:MAG: class I SAM-dependent methyltransferase [Chloroflexi bacterium]|nr:class I SAM-dependent methyltransferase [Chloroflexota bacterium]
MSSSIVSPVREQYEAFPYPPRDPTREMDRLYTTLIGQLALANHVLWGGSRRPGPDFRVLDAGCGTGDNTIFVAEQLRGTGAKVVGIDLSEQSLSIARERARVRGLDIQLHHARIEELPALGLGAFDYVVSAGVLHHLPSPAAGLAAIRDVLKPGGGIGLMVYGEYGRTAIYQLQSLFRLIAPDTLPAAERLDTVRKTLRGLRADHWATFGKGTYSAEIDLHGDAGIYDVFLHSTDRAYTVPAIHEWLAGAGMELVRFIMPATYDPAFYSSTIDCRQMPELERQAVAELLHGRMQKHSFFAAPIASPQATRTAIGDPAGVPTWLRFDHDGLIRRQVEERPELHLQYEGLELRMTLDPFRRLLLKRVDGRRPLGEIMAALAERFPKVSAADRWVKWREVAISLDQFNLLGVFPPA